MGTTTWRQLIGSDYGAGMTQPVDLRRLHVPPPSPVLVDMKALMIRGLALGAERPTQNPDFVGQGAVTPHNVGAAIDMFYDATKDPQRAFGNALVDLFIRHRRAMGWGWMAYNRVSFGQNSTGKPDDPHTSHIHIDWVDDARTRRSTELASFTYIDGTNMTKTKSPGGRGQDVEMSTNAAADRAVPLVVVNAYEALCRTWSPAIVKTFDSFGQQDIDDAYAGVARGTDLSWLLGWWSVWDGQTYYYRFDHEGKVKWYEGKPRGDAAVGSPGNSGTYAWDESGKLVVTWRAFPPKPPTVETFLNAVPDTKLMNAVSNNYSPPVATRIE